MKSYEDTIQTVANTLTQAALGGPFGFYLSDTQIAFLYDKEREVVEMDMQMAKDLANQRLTDSFI
jgi:hypothetical protein